MLQILQLGASDEDLSGHFAGPAFLAWGRMGNLNSWGGPLWPGDYKMLFARMQSSLHSFYLVWAQICQVTNL